MRRRILKMMIACLVAMGVMFGVPMTIITWDWFSTSTQQDLAERLKRMSEHVLAEESAGRAVQPRDLDLDEFRLLVPPNGRLTSLTAPPTPARRTAIGWARGRSGWRSRVRRSRSR